MEKEIKLEELKVCSYWKLKVFDTGVQRNVNVYLRLLKVVETHDKYKKVYIFKILCDKFNQRIYLDPDLAIERLEKGTLKKVSKVQLPLSIRKKIKGGKDVKR